MQAAGMQAAGDKNPLYNVDEEDIEKKCADLVGVFGKF